MSVLDGRGIVDKFYVTFPKDSVFDTDEQVQPNGVDLRVDKVFLMEGELILPREQKARFDGQAHEVPTKEGWFHLRPPASGAYLIDFLESAKIPDGYCAQVVTRSSLVRAGIDVITGLWDTGWEGRLGASLRLKSPCNIQYGARLAQIVFTESRFNGHRYVGRYQGTTSRVQGYV